MKTSWLQRLTLMLLVGLVLCVCTWAPVASAEDAPRVIGRRLVEPTIRLQPILAPATGSAAFYITEEWLQQVPFATGIFSAAGAFGDDERSVHTVRAHYTVLSADGESVRLIVRAQPVHPVTGLPIAPARWEAIYALEPDGPSFESGDDVPASYNELVKPYWLADWSAVELEDLPSGPLRPGAQWSGPANLDWDDFPVQGLEAPVNATFVGWVDAGDFGRAAHISETMETDGADTEEFSSGIYGIRSIALQALSDHWLLEGDFPYGTEKWLYMYSIMSVGPSTGAPTGIEGEIHFTMEMAQSVVRDENEELWLPFVDDETIGTEQPVLGVLGPWNDTMDDGAYMKVFDFEGAAGDVIDIRLESPDFDAYLILLDEVFNVLASDDDSAGGANSLITTELPYTGVYYILVTTLAEGEEGFFTLEVQPSGEN